MPIAYVRSWDEKEHPRGPGGKFATAGSLRIQPSIVKMMHPEGEEFYKSAHANTPLAGPARDAVKSYAWNPTRFEQMNSALRGDPNRPVDPDTAKAIDELTQVMQRSHLRHPLKVYRGVPDDERTRAWLADRGSGNTVIDHGFASTSTDPEVATMMADPTDEGGGLVLEMKLPTGTRAVSIGDQFDAEGGFNQKEILLQRGSKFKVGRRRKVNGRTHVTLTLVSQP
jgi:hypothetical protein